MKLGQSIAALTVVAGALLGTHTLAGNLDMGDLPDNEQLIQLPPAEYASARWTHPNGCDYSRAGRPGEKVWYLIINSLGDKDCVRFFVEQPLAGTSVASYYTIKESKTANAMELIKLPFAFLGLE